ncbi:hypothetical protein WN51_12129 [Melipona quadrifasciata]|uniref:Uncharacterized protein n=1 Tax=Melipona quadrifasciata TaxID=166423 RepID=A0A0N0BHQ9_9HYME|nr:hypothetical protein WN51_12129 [Melipona quadrifasciata]
MAQPPQGARSELVSSTSYRVEPPCVIFACGDEGNFHGAGLIGLYSVQ